MTDTFKIDLSRHENEHMKSDWVFKCVIPLQKGLELFLL